MDMEGGTTGSNCANIMTSEQIMSDLTNAPDNDIIFITHPPGLAGSAGGTETDLLVQNCVHLVNAHQSLSSAEGLSSLPKIASEVEQYSKELSNSISSTSDR